MESSNKVFVFVFCHDNVKKWDIHLAICEKLLMAGYSPVSTILTSQMELNRKRPYQIINEIDSCNSIAIFGKIDYDNEYFRYALDINKPILSKRNYV